MTFTVRSVVAAGAGEPVSPVAADRVAVVVLDTNIVLDLLLFEDPAVVRLHQTIESGAAQFLTTIAMREEFERVLAYPKIAAWQKPRGKLPDEMLGLFDRLSHRTAAAPSTTVRCTDPDDQIFIDLAVAHKAFLLTKDRAVLSLRKRLAELTERERDVMQLVVEGLPNKLIADGLDISVRTVEVHRARVFDKMEVKSAVELVNMLQKL